MTRAHVVSWLLGGILLFIQFLFETFRVVPIEPIFFGLGWALGSVLVLIDERSVFDRFLWRVFDRVPGAEMATESDADSAGSTPVTRSLIFQLALLASGVYLITTAQSMLGSAMVLSMATVLVAEMTLLRRDAQQFNQTFLQHVEGAFDPALVQRVVWGGWAALVLLVSLYLSLQLYLGA